MRYTMEFNMKFYNYAIFNCKDLYYFLDISLKSKNSYSLFLLFLEECEDQNIKLEFENIRWEDLIENWDSYVEIWEQISERDGDFRAIMSDDSQLDNLGQIESIPFLHKCVKPSILPLVKQLHHLVIDQHIFDDIGTVINHQFIVDGLNINAEVQEMSILTFYQVVQKSQTFESMNLSTKTLILSEMQGWVE